MGMRPGDEGFNNLTRAEWQGFAGLSELAYRSLVKKNQMYALGVALDTTTTTTT